MSHLCPTPTKLLLAVSLGLLICVAGHERRTHRQTATTAVDSAGSDGLRYPGCLVQQRNPVVLASFTLDDPSPPDAPQLNESAPAPLPQQNFNSTRGTQGERPSVSGQPKITRSVLRRLPPIDEQPVKPRRLMATDQIDSSDGPSEKAHNGDDDGASWVADRPTRVDDLRAKPTAPTKEARQLPTSLMAAKKIPGPDPVRVAVSRRAMAFVRKGQSLAVRNAQYSARADFVQALRLIAQAEDAAQRGSQHSKDLAAGLLALREAEDFVPSGRGRWTDQFDVRVISAAHGTPVIRAQGDGGEQQPEMTAWRARQAYYAFAQKKLAQAGAGDAVASAALSSLGKLYVGRDGTAGEDNLVSSSQAMAFFQAALRVDSRNYTAANELGVLLARYGQLRDARQVLQHGVATVKDFPPLWKNLAVVHQRLGEIDFERQARHEFQLARQRIHANRSQADGGNSIRWVDTDTFAGRTRPPGRPQTAGQSPRGNRTTERKKPSWRFW